MSEQNPTPDATPTEALELPDQQPIAPQPAAAAPAAEKRGNHTRTILEVVGGVVAAGLIVVAGIAGFAVGHATGSDNDGRWSMSGDSRGDMRGDAWAGEGRHDDDDHGDHEGGWDDDGGMMPGGPMGGQFGGPGQQAPQAPAQ